MIATALRSLAQRKLRTALTAVAILLGVAMIAGTYVQTDQISTAFEDIERSAYAGVDVTIAPKTAFTGDFAPEEPISERLVAEAAAVPGAAKAEGQLFESGSLVVDGEVVAPQFAPTIVTSTSQPPFDPLRVVTGRMPRSPGEVVVSDESLAVGERVGVTTRTGVKPVRVVGIVRYGDADSMGGATLVVASLDEVQRWFEREGRVSEIAVAAEEGVEPAELARRIDARLPGTLEVRTGEQTAADTLAEIDDAMGFLTPALLAFAGAAVLVGAFIIFNTFSITIAERTREFALLRALGATRGQVLRAVGAEALALALAASALGLLAGLGVARGLGALFDASGMGIPRGAMELAPRTIVISLAVGIGVTLLAALVPALRAMRVPPVVAMQEQASAAPPRRPRLRAAATALVAVAGVALLAQGLLGGGTATSRLGAMGAGTLLVFIGVAASARYIVRPLAAIAGWPFQRSGDVTAQLARENATRNPGRTAVTAAALMVGLGLVVFVAVFAAGLKDSLNGSIDDRLRADYIVTSDTISPLPAQTERTIEAAAGAGSATAQFVDQVSVDGQPVNTVTDALNGLDPATLGNFYEFDWRDGSDAAIAQLRGTNALVEEQFAKQHGLAVGDRFRMTGPTGRTATFTAVAEYRDPLLLQGVVVAPAAFRRLSASTDPFAVWVTAARTAPAGGIASQADLRTALAEFPTAKVRTLDEYRDFVGGRVDQIIYMLYALLAMSLIISLFGIANSLFLSIHERTRELGMLRAIGATAGQVKRLIRYESVITAVIGGLLGTAIGVLFAWLTTFALEDLGLGFSIPFGQLAVLLALAVVVGVIGAIAPARRAARLNILRAVGTGE